MTWARRAGGVASNHSQKPLRPSGSVRSTVNGAELLVVQQRRNREQGGFGVAHTVRQATRMTSSMRGPQCRWKIAEKIDDVVHDEVFVAAGRSSRG